MTCRQSVGNGILLVVFLSFSLAGAVASATASEARTLGVLDETARSESASQWLVLFRQGHPVSPGADPDLGPSGSWRRLLPTMAPAFAGRGLDRLYVLTTTPSVDASTLARLRAHPAVESVTRDAVTRTLAIPNDPLFVDAWPLDNTGQTGGTPDADIDALEVWDLNRGSGVIVAVLDSGVDYDHPDLAENIWINPGEIPNNGVDDDLNGYVDDVRGWDFFNGDNDPFDDGSGHGTHIAGIIAGVQNTASGSPASGRS